ncbi:hypothetical protein [Prosthecomicrobium sp. N25]|uniref:hypothetical protein n=1 Tax=Prosthecomicrobium sp. N25 TaxID=3129254 RepID=UPI00307894DB
MTPQSIRATRLALGWGLVLMIVGGLLFMLAGFAFTAIAGTSCFEGYCAWVPFLYFTPLGMVAGFVLGAKVGAGKAGG